jgi:hypothetical protein
MAIALFLLEPRLLVLLLGGDRFRCGREAGIVVYIQVCMMRAEIWCRIHLSTGMVASEEDPQYSIARELCDIFR